MPTIHWTSIDDNQRSFPNSSEDTPTLTTIMSVIDYLTTDINVLVLTVSTPIAKLDTSHEKLQIGITSNFWSLCSDIFDKINAVNLNVDDAIMSSSLTVHSNTDNSLIVVHSEWRSAIA